LILEEAEIERVAPAILFGALSNSGQTCIGVGRVLVPRSLEPALTAALVQLIGKLRQGNPMSGPVELGALTTHAQIERCRHHVSSAIKNGSKLEIGGSPVEPGHFFEPTLLSGCKLTDRVAAEETFGPVIALIPYDNESLTIDALNADEVRLVAYVFGRESDHLTQVAERLDYGQVISNQVLYTYVCPELPLAGFKGSGQGITHGREGLLSFSTPKLLGASKLRLPPILDFASLDPARADTLAHTFLSSTSAIKRVSRWWKA
jgi:acyl-CoA reductase-like NAD-dependent aldehyde dehydrogenase